MQKKGITHKPLVNRTGGEIGLQNRNIEWDNTNTLGPINHKKRTNFTAPSTNANQVNKGAITPDIRRKSDTKSN
jgi:hypothetical protein